MTFVLFDEMTECSIEGPLLDLGPCSKGGFQENPEAGVMAAPKESGVAVGDHS